jgi:SAM-dependent methyltransferase
MAAQKGFKVTAVDLENVEWPFVHPNLVFQQGDMLLMTFPSEYFDLILNCSSVEHVGLAGRYSVSEANEDGDLKVMNRLRDMLKFSGRMLLTVPIGIDSVFAPLARIYGKKRLPKLLDGYDIEEECYWIKDEHNRWILCDKNHALSFPASAGSWDHTRNIYALGCFSLKRAI